MDTFRNFAYVSSGLKAETCMETRLCNIFKTANAMMFTETVLESTLKFAKVHEKEFSEPV